MQRRPATSVISPVCQRVTPDATIHHVAPVTDVPPEHDLWTESSRPGLRCQARARRTIAGKVQPGGTMALAGAACSKFDRNIKTRQGFLPALKDRVSTPDHR